MAKRKARPWKCSKRSCGNINRVGTRKCQKCGKARPVRKAPTHQSVLKKLTYQDFIDINGGEFCFVCEQLPLSQQIRTTMRFNRDHAHVGYGLPRGLLCNIHNKQLANMSLELVQAFVLYLERAKSPEFLAQVKKFWSDD